MSYSDDVPPSHLRQALVAAVIVAVGAATALAIRFSGERSVTTLDDLPDGGPPVVVATARDVPIRATVTVAGRLEARRTVDLTPEVAGRLVEIRADVGDLLTSGSAAFRLDDRDARLAVEDRRARLASAEARERQTERQAERRERLGEAGISSPELVEQARLDGDVAGADLVVARQELRQAERELEKTTVLVPWTGTVVERHADPGAWLVPGGTVLRLVDLSQLDVMLDVPASDAVHLRTGDEARVRFSALPGESFDGRIRFVAGETNDADHQFPVALELAGDERLGAGMIAEVELELSRAGRGAAVPLDSVDRDARGPFVWLVDGGRVHRRSVVLAGSRGGQAIVSAGLEPGDRVVVTVSAQLEDGLEIGQVTEGLRRPARD